jgi:hypothetical protein
LDGPKGLVRRNRERLKDIPTERAGIGLLLDVNGVVEEVSNGVPLHHAPGISSARSVILVDLRQRLIAVEVSVPSREVHRDIQATATFACQVRSASAIAESQGDDFVAALTGWTSTVVRRRSRGVASDRPADLETVGRQALVRALGRTPLVRATDMSITLASFEVHLSDDHRKVLLDRDERTDAANTQILQLELDDRVGHQAGMNAVNADERDWERRRWSASQYEEAIARGPQAVMALMLAEDPSQLSAVLNHQLQDKQALYHFLVDVTRSPHIDGSVLEPYAKHLADAVGQQLKIGPALGPMTGLSEGASWPADGSDEAALAAGKATQVESGDGSPFDLDAVLPGEGRPGQGSGEQPGGRSSGDDR